MNGQTLQRLGLRGSTPESRTALKPDLGLPLKLFAKVGVVLGRTQ